MPSKLIPIGCNCSVTFSMIEQGLKQESTLFEWVQTNNLTIINQIMAKLIDNIESDIVFGKDMRIYLMHNNSDAFTFHYTVAEYREIFKRRAVRLFDMIKTYEGEIIFTRIIMPKFGMPSYNEISEFMRLIKTINPNANIKLLIIQIINKRDQFAEMTGDNIIHKYILQNTFKDIYARDSPLFYKALRDIFESVGLDMPAGTNVYNDKD